jgi:hypothetical protein
MKINILKLIFVIIFLCCGYNSNAQESDKTLRVFLLQSYGQNDFCGGPQLVGAKQVISQLSDIGYKITVREFYMNTKTRNVTQSSIREVSKLAYDSIKKFKPNYIIVFDDIAFTYVGIKYLLPLNEFKSKVIFSGLNKTIDSYKSEFSFDATNLSGIEEIPQIVKLDVLFNKVGFIPSRYYILRDSTLSSFLLTKIVQTELDKQGFRRITDVLYIDNISDLRQTIKGLNRENTRGVIFCLLTAIIDSNSGQIVIMPDILREIRKLNTTHLEISVNPLAVQPDIGFAMAVGPDLYQMGNDAGDIILTSVIESDVKPVIARPQSLLAVNTRRMNQLGLTSYYKNASYIFNRMTTSID